MSELPKAYDPALVEPRWYEFWEKQGVFRASLDPNLVGRFKREAIGIKIVRNSDPILSIPGLGREYPGKGAESMLH